MANRGPVILTIRNGGMSSSSGVNCCCCRCCTCLNIRYLKSQEGLYKLAEAILGSFCQSLALEFGMSYAGAMGASYYGFLTTCSWCVMTTILLLACYILSEKSVGLIRQSMFEFIFNLVASFCYLSSTSYLGYIVNTILFPIFKSTAYFQAYPAMTGAYLLGTVVGIIHGIDAYKSYKYFKGSFSQSLALEFGMSYAGAMGASYYGFLTTCYYYTSSRLLHFIGKVSRFNSAINVCKNLSSTLVASFCYLSSTSYLGYIVNTILFPIFKSIAYFQAYPAMTGAYLLGTVVGVIHGIDAYKSYKYFKGYR